MTSRYYEQLQPAAVCLTNLQNGTTAADIRVALDEFGAITHVFLSKIAPFAPPSATVVFSRLADAREAVRELNGAWDNDWVIKATILEVTPSTGLALLLRIR
ncbi:hypothetical protein MJO28_016811 [Puccinia striiformis f. sp. tritici]|uniref:RRM domain-containing protein n=3 Tax=Puccinia striiformis TaxID=27350 RepID=A0A0L0UVF4_9BASI|nr:hypothetical protein Pst134EA_025938 [Puccinia striiformis f. sp. tritici]KNE90985.1 hypothetical protein PSTG_15588 [Puccinia striiformis f. sp. tritici PST-78]POV97899.1 hypothetical protein PSTT_14764 [Puccinia striiformis]KAH9444134.1 hypothetical protein Pst134EB_026513 [Puccinia striiformis f. sp. tritici]KAH9452001.1 hypothetical protein Pst134EA_025938 [Puccinia striiformis f. sp. tritici]KAI7935256.1 hypothetical protein MJO28_016783 [Puccinia striiformis f. sp. tritici]